MKLRLSKILVISLIITMMIFSFCNPNPGDNTISGSAVFSIPKTITGTSRDLFNGKEITSGTEQFIGMFFSYVREQILIADSIAGQVKDWIVALESYKVFQLTEPHTTQNEKGDIIRWTPNTTSGEYLLEWWAVQDSDSSLKKLLEMKFTEYDINVDPIKIAGTLIIDVTASNEQEPLNGKNPDWYKITFDSDVQGKKYMKIEADEYLIGDLEEGTDYQETILEAWKDSNGMVEVLGATSVPGTTVLNFEESPELRYYIYEGKGNEEKATINLAMPLDSYTASGVFNDFENTVGGILREYQADNARNEAVNNWTGSLIQILSALGYLSVTEGTVAEDPSPNPTTTELFNAIKDLYESGDITNPDDEELVENWLYAMSVENPAYFDDKSYTGFGDGDYAPADVDTYPTDLPELTINSTDVDNLAIAFEGDIDPPVID
jgi:hypothetical protein